jgi:prophage regulatory protein
MADSDYYLRKTLLQKIPLSDVTIWRLEKSGGFPKRRQLSPGRVGWLASEVETWILSRKEAAPLKEAA